MKYILRFIFVLLLFEALNARSQGIIIDHHHTDISAIPATVIDDIQDNIKFHYAHTSYGDQHFCGILQIKEMNPEFDFAVGGDPFDPFDPPYLPNVAGALCIYNGNDGYKYITPTGYWLGNGMGMTQSTLLNNPEINISGWSWCDELDTFSEDEVQEYLDSISSLEQQFPEVTFIYFTGEAQGGGIFDPVTGYNRHMRCDQIRQYCAMNNKILFDFEDIDCWYNGEMNYYIYGTDTVPIQHSAYNGDECGHVDSLSSLQKGKALWWMLARLRGWEPESRALNVKLFLEGNYDETGMNTDLNLQGFLPLNQPYNFPPLNYNGTENVTSIPADIVDWVLLEMRDAASAELATTATTIEKRAAFIRNDGFIVDLDGTSNIPFSHTLTQQLFVVVRHRNHLAVMSADPLSEAGNVLSYDFTMSNSKAYGGNNSQVQLSDNIWGMISGDGNQDGIIDISDKNDTWMPESGKMNYSAGDFNLNGNINNPDKIFNWFANYGKISYVP